MEPNPLCLRNLWQHRKMVSLFEWAIVYPMLDKYIYLHSTKNVVAVIDKEGFLTLEKMVFLEDVYSSPSPFFRRFSITYFVFDTLTHSVILVY